MEYFVGVLYEAEEKRFMWWTPSRPSAGICD